MNTPVPEALAQALASEPTRPPNILRTVLAVQRAIGYVSPDAIGEIARHLGVTEADVAGVVSFYPVVRTREPGRHLIRLCVGESCVANHCARILTALGDELRIGLHARTPDGRFTLERVYCMGNCAVSPTLLIDEDLYGRVTPGDIPRLLEKYR
ncbi:NADH-quinone oxidoreductase subunit NuoE family protein [Candidatus Nitrospira bockiana]